MTVKKIANLIYDRVCGTPDEIMLTIDNMVEDGDIDEDFFYKNEIAILSEVDHLMFNCEVCGWNYPINDMSEHEHSVCENCDEQNNY